MQKIGASTDTADSSGEFTEGSAAQGIYATLLRSEWLNTIQRELVSVVEKSGFALDPDKDDQVYTAIKTIIRSADSSFAVDGGTANVYVVNYTPTFTALANGMPLRFLAKTTNSGASTITVNGIGPKPLLGAAQQALQGGEVFATGIADIVYSVGLDSWILRGCTGANIQVPTGTKSQHAINLGQLQASYISYFMGQI
ncbi:hypothetical protein [Pseudomonas sp. DSP3-2-2]|uniref:hypothetical protein n=1 Tax=unclassified Pseudomonas TaxID=196821 RepID=UPI003CE71407